jgi:hypothetical protein
MPLVNAKCTNCGANLNVDNTKDAAVCEFCGSAFIVEKAIQNYNYHITNNINAQNVVITGKGEAEKERLLNNAKTNEKFGDYAKAQSIYMQITEDYPDDYRGWLGIALIKSDNYSKYNISQAEFEAISSDTNKALICAPPEIEKSIRSQWDDYRSKHSSFISKKKDKIKANKNRIVEINKALNEEYIKLNNLQKIVKQSDYNEYKYYVSKGKCDFKFNKGWYSLLILAAIAFILGILGNIFGGDPKSIFGFGAMLIIAFFIIFYYNKKKFDNCKLLDEAKEAINSLTIERNTLEKEIESLKTINII